MDNFGSVYLTKGPIMRVHPMDNLGSVLSYEKADHEGSLDKFDQELFFQKLLFRVVLQPDGSAIRLRFIFLSVKRPQYKEEPVISKLLQLHWQHPLRCANCVTSYFTTELFRKLF